MNSKVFVVAAGGSAPTCWHAFGSSRTREVMTVGGMPVRQIGRKIDGWSIGDRLALVCGIDDRCC